MEHRELSIFQKAKSLLIERGWFGGGDSVYHSSEMCLVLALAVAISPPGSRSFFSQPWATDDAAMDEALAKLGFASVDEAIRWNDAPGRTLVEVLERLDRGDMPNELEVPPARRSVSSRAMGALMLLGPFKWIWTDDDEARPRGGEGAGAVVREVDRVAGTEALGLGLRNVTDLDPDGRPQEVFRWRLNGDAPAKERERCEA